MGNNNNILKREDKNMSTKNKKLAYNIGRNMAKIIILATYLIALYIILANFNIFKIELVTDTIKSWIEVVFFNNLFIYEL